MKTNRWVMMAAGMLAVGAVAMAARAGTAQEPEPRRVTLRDAVARQARLEPSVDRVVRAAIEHARLDPDRASRLASRARLAGLLPRARVGARRGLGWDLNQVQASGDGRVQLATGDDLAVYGEVSFDLDRLVRASEEVPLLREERAVARERERLIEAVVSLYYERRRLLLERELEGAWGVERAIRVEETTALLDGLTDGAFSRMRAERSRARRSGLSQPGGDRIIEVR